jgi:hypothetical protein
MRLLILITFSLLISCKLNQTKKEEIQKADCSAFNDKYIEYLMADKRDSALYYIDKAIFCDPEDEFFKTEKIKLFLKYGDYSDAVEFAKKLSNDKAPTYKMLYGILLLKQNNNVKADIVLNEAYTLLSEKTKLYDKGNSNLHFYRLGLDNYFMGKDYSLEMVKKYRENYTKEHDAQLADYIENLITNESSRDILYKLYNIED